MNVILYTERIYLREMNVNDAISAFELNNDRDVIKYTGDPPFQNVESVRQFLKNYSDYEKYGYGRWAVILKSTNEFLGWCGLKYSPDLHETDLGFRFAQKYWKNGFATEAAIACIDYGFKILNLTTIVGRVMKENIASIRVLEKCGMKYMGEFDFEKHPGVLYQIDNTLL